MSPLTLTKTRLNNGIWEGRLSGDLPVGQNPEIRVDYRDRPVEGVDLTESPEGWNLRIPVPPRAMADGVHSFLIYDGATDTKLGDFVVIAGDIAHHSLRAEVELLRAELDMLKRAFRRHCMETQ
ncbi:metallophosphoesterase [Ruegeria sp. HKCCD8929]|uniref:metallophosphoesterase n=1 Tax=Ruegeria sp. HKCCD8929 TaxID=2683006 RepID=UPI001489DE2D|nr:metallophosphoesterase [Ruegeria sp. HKCCD8929]